MKIPTQKGEYSCKCTELSLNEKREIAQRKARSFIQQHSATFSNIQQHSATFSNIRLHSATFGRSLLLPVLSIYMESKGTERTHYTFS